MTLEEKTGKNYISHSAMSTWLNCGWSYYLSRIQNVPQNPSYWLVGGKALHELTEIYDALPLGSPFDSTAVFNQRWNENYKQMISQEQIDYMLEMMYSLSALEKQINEEHEFWMLRVNNSDLGYFSISKKDPHVYFINKLYLKTNHHGAGLGSDFLNDVIIR